MDWIAVLMLMAVAIGGLGWLMSGGRGGVREHVSEMPRTQFTPQSDTTEMLRRSEDGSWTSQAHRSDDCGTSHGFWGGGSDHGSSSSSSSSSGSSSS